MGSNLIIFSGIFLLIHMAAKNLTCASPVTPPPPSNAPTEKCPFGLSFKLQCNTCMCNPASGMIGCTQRGCPTSPPLYYWQSNPPTLSSSSAAPRDARSDSSSSSSRLTRDSGIDNLGTLSSSSRTSGSSRGSSSGSSSRLSRSSSSSSGGGPGGRFTRTNGASPPVQVQSRQYELLDGTDDNDSTGY